MKVLTFSKHFPKGHPKAGRPTCFVEKVLIRLVEDKLMMKSKCVEMARATGIHEHHPLYYIDTINDFDRSLLKGHTIRAGNRWKPGDMASLRIWSDKPYRSKQIEFAQVEVKKTWDIEINEFWFINDLILEHEKVMELAKNDGLAYEDFINWFTIHPKNKDQTFRGQVICWSDSIEYGKPLLTEKSLR
jgi:hypothetical protein